MVQPASKRLVTEQSIKTGPARRLLDAVVDPLKEVRAPGVVPVIGGQADETLTVTNCTVAADTVTKRTGSQSWKLTTTGAATLTANLPALTTGETITDPMSAVGVMFYLAAEDVAKVTFVGIDFYPGVGDANSFRFSAQQLRGGYAAQLKAGWNIIRWTPEFATTTGAPGTWGSVHHARFVLACNAAMSVNLQQVFVEVRAKASLLFIHDGGYKTFDQTPGYPDLLARNIPVTWSVDCAYIGVSEGHVTDQRLREIGAENRNSIGFHGWDDTTMDGATGAAAQSHTMRAIKWLSRRGFTGRIWRSAWLRNTAQNSGATDSMVVANPYFGGFGGNRWQNAWPFIDRYCVFRTALQGRTQAQIDEYFAVLKRDRGVFVAYTHRVSNAGNPADMTFAEWAYFLNKVDAAVAEGWLECVTLETLLAGSGVPIRRGLGGALTVDWPNIDGTTERIFLP